MLERPRPAGGSDAFQRRRLVAEVIDCVAHAFQIDPDIVAAVDGHRGQLDAVMSEIEVEGDAARGQRFPEAETVPLHGTSRPSIEVTEKLVDRAADLGAVAADKVAFRVAIRPWRDQLA